MDRKERSRGSHSQPRPQPLLEEDNSANDGPEDCIGWDESKNLDLRKIASPHFQTPRTTLTPTQTPSTSVASSVASSSHLSSGAAATTAFQASKKPWNSLGEVSRCLAEQEQSMEKKQQRGHQHTRRPTTSHHSRSASPAPEEEIDGLFYRLEHEQGQGHAATELDNDESSYAAATLDPTPRQKNTRPGAQQPTILDTRHNQSLPAISTEGILPIKSRKRRRREQALQMAREKEQGASGNATLASRPPNPDTLHPPMRAAGGTGSTTPSSSRANLSMSNDFQDLLEKVKTPSPNMPPPGRGGGGVVSSRVVPSVTNTYRSNSQSSSQPSVAVPLQLQSHSYTKPLSQPQTKSTPLPVNNMYKSSSQTLSQTNIVPPKPNTVFRAPLPPVAAQPTNGYSKPPVPLMPTKNEVTTATTATVADNDNDYDEFGDVDFSLANIEAMSTDNKVTTSTGTAAADNKYDEFGDVDFSLANIAAMSTDNEVTTTTTATAAAADNNYDEFGDVDFSLANIAAMSTDNEVTTTTTAAAADNDYDEFGDVDFSLDDIAQMDSMVMAATQGETTASSPPNAVSTKRISAPRLADDPQPVPSATTAPRPTANVPVPVQASTNKNKIELTDNDNNGDEFGDEFGDDPFGDFPEIDYGELDKTIAQRKTSAQRAPDGSSDLDRDLRYLAQLNAASTVPPALAPVCNPRVPSTSADLLYLAFSRYKVIRVDLDDSTYTKTLAVASWQTTMLKEDDPKAIHRSDTLGRTQRRTTWTIDGVLHLRGEWYHTRVDEGDIIHVCSLRGTCRTDSSALPLILHTNPPAESDNDDLILIVHPDMLLTPTGISETVSCTRRAILKLRLGSSGLTSKAPLFGTMRHDLFEATMREKDFSIETATKHVQDIVRRNAEGLIACGVSSTEAEREIIRFLPQLQRFANDFTDFGSAGKGRKSIDQLATLERHGAPSAIRFVASDVDAIEEPVISPELGLKGNVDMVVRATSVTAGPYVSRPSTSLTSVELKTGHNQRTQNAHMAQLALYMLMLQVRNGSQTSPDSKALGASDGGMLLYMNSEALRAVHVAPVMGEIKSLIGQRNVVASELLRASRPRGIVLSYENEIDSSDRIPRIDLLDPPPAALPDLLPSSYSCTKCYANRECMMYAGAAQSSMADGELDTVGKTHTELLQQTTGHLTADDFAYFQKWDRLVDIEADIVVSSAAEAWLIGSEDREKATSKTMSHLTFNTVPSADEIVLDDSRLVLLSFQRSVDSPCRTSLANLGLEKGCYAIVSTDSTTCGQSPALRQSITIRPQMHIVRGALERITDTHIFIRASRDDRSRIQKVVAKAGAPGVVFRVDRDEVATGAGTLRQNLVNLFTKDLPEKPDRLSWLRDAIVRLRVPAFNGALKKTLFFSGLGIHGVPGCDLKDLRREFLELNTDQQAAVEKVITAKDYTLIQGLPGTGKTSTIAFVARLLAARGKRVLITSYTHAAVDNVLLKLLEKGLSATNKVYALTPLVRVGRGSSCHPGVHPILSSRIAVDLEQPEASECDKERIMPSADSLRRTMSSARIVGVTALSIPRSPLLIGEHFDVVIVDEAGQISQPAIIGALIAADSFVLVGDHMQLPPLVSSELAEKGGFGVSMLKHLADQHSDSVAQLTYQYRMHEDICQLSNDIVYNGSLKCANDEVRWRRLELNGFPENIPSINRAAPGEWLLRAIDPRNPVIFVNTDKIGATADTNEADSIIPHERASGGGNHGNIVNDMEARIVRLLVGGLLGCGLDASSIGVICPFRAQLRILNDCTLIKKWTDNGLELSTIDRYQGRDKPVIILSFVRSNVKGRVGRLLEDFRRLNVALTRAKYKLIMLGSFSTLYRGSDVLKPVLDRVRNESRVVDPLQDVNLLS